MTFVHGELFDSVLVVAGLVLVIIGLVMFVRSKSAGDASSVEAFGIKLNVTHPSLILVVVGVGLMLAPRLLPGLPGMPGSEPSAATAPAEVPPSPTPADAGEAAPETARPPASAKTKPDASEPAPAQPAAPAKPDASARLADARAAGSTPPPVSPAASRPAPPAPARPSAEPRPAARLAETRPAEPAAAEPAASPPAATRSGAPSVTSSPEPAPAIIALAPTPPPKAARPVVAFAALGLPISRDFWSGETQASYTRRMVASLRDASQTVLRMTPRNLDLDADAFNRWWNESRDHPVSRAYCEASGAPRALVSARIETPVTTSRAESAYWPEFSLRLYHCATHRIYRQQRTLSPANSDDWPFSSDLTADIERFFRTYRADLAD